MFIVVRDEVRALAYAVTIRADTIPVQRELACATYNTVTRCWATARLAEWRTLRAVLAVAEAAVRAGGAGGRGRLQRYTLCPVVRVLGETSLASDAVTGAISALCASQLAYYTDTMSICRIDAISLALPLQSPSDEEKNPSAHLAHAVPFVAVVHPALHVHCPFDPQTPFKQLQAVELVDCGTKQRPLPVIPSSQV